MAHSVTTNGATGSNEWKLVVQRVTMTDKTSDNERYNEWEQITTGYSDLY